MPYIKQTDRNSLCQDPIPLSVFRPKVTGELNYILSRMIHQYITDHGLCYACINEVVGVLECVKLELYRQIAAPYEDIKKAENGPVSTLDAS